MTFTQNTDFTIDYKKYNKLNNYNTFTERLSPKIQISLQTVLNQWMTHPKYRFHYKLLNNTVLNDFYPKYRFHYN